MADNREALWKDDDSLKEALEAYVRQGLQRKEVLDFVKHDFDQYTWSLRSLDRRLRHFQIFYKDDTVEVADVMDAVVKELNGPGKLLGYHAMHKKVRQEHGLNVTRDQVYDVMTDLDPEGLEARGALGARENDRKAISQLKDPTGYTLLMATIS